MKNIGLLVTKNEDDIIEETLSKNIKYFDDIYALDGSYDKTPDIIKTFNSVKLFLEKDYLYHPFFKKTCTNRWTGKNNPHNSIRGFLLEKIRGDYSELNEPVWIHLIHGDEVFYHNPIKVSLEAEKENADNVYWYCMHYFLHTTDKDKWEDIKNLPVEDRLTWYSWGYSGHPDLPWRETITFKLRDDIKYYPGRDELEPRGLNKRYSKTPIYKHFNMHNPNRMLDDRNRWGMNHNSGYFTDIIKDRSGNYFHSSKFDGGFGKWEKGVEHLK